MNRPHDEVSIVEILFDIISLILPIRAALALTSMHLSNLVACSWSATHDCSSRTIFSLVLLWENRIVRGGHGDMTKHDKYQSHYWIRTSTERGCSELPSFLFLCHCVEMVKEFLTTNHITLAQYQVCNDFWWPYRYYQSNPIRIGIL
jgi:hypothetical protein